MRSLTERQHRNADEAADSWNNESSESGPFASHWLPVHHKHAEEVSRDFYSSGDERVDENVAVKLTGVESQSEVYQTTCEPIHHRLYVRQMMMTTITFLRSLHSQSQSQSQYVTYSLRSWAVESRSWPANFPCPELARPAADGWPLIWVKTVRCRSANQANSAFHPFEVDKLSRKMIWDVRSSDAIWWMLTGLWPGAVETIA